jgi:hypothetical protein
LRRCGGATAWRYQTNRHRWREERLQSVTSIRYTKLRESIFNRGFLISDLDSAIPDTPPCWGGTNASIPTSIVRVLSILKSSIHNVISVVVLHRVRLWYPSFPAAGGYRSASRRLTSADSFTLNSAYVTIRAGGFTTTGNLASPCHSSSSSSHCYRGVSY